MNIDLISSNMDYTVNEMKAHINVRHHIKFYSLVNEDDTTSSLNAPGCPARSDSDAIFATATEIH